MCTKQSSMIIGWHSSLDQAWHVPPQILPNLVSIHASNFGDVIDPSQVGQFRKVANSTIFVKHGDRNGRNAEQVMLKRSERHEGLHGETLRSLCTKFIHNSSVPQVHLAFQLSRETTNPSNQRKYSIIWAELSWSYSTRGTPLPCKQNTAVWSLSECRVRQLRSLLLPPLLLLLLPPLPTAATSTTPTPTLTTPTPVTLAIAISTTAPQSGWGGCASKASEGPPFSMRHLWLVVPEELQGIRWLQSRHLRSWPVESQR